MSMTNDGPSPRATSGAAAKGRAEKESPLSRPEGRGRRWTIYVCPECGQRGFEERVASLNATADSLREQVLGRDGEVERLREALEAIRATPRGEKHRSADGRDWSYVLNGHQKAVAIANAALGSGSAPGEEQELEGSGGTGTEGT